MEPPLKSALRVPTALLARHGLIRNGTTIRIRSRAPGVARLFAVLLVAASTYLLYRVGGALGDVVQGIAVKPDMLADQTFRLLVGLIFMPLGAVTFVARAHVDIDGTLGRVTDVHRFGPVRIARTVSLFNLNRVRTTTDFSSDLPSYKVELVGARPKQPIPAGSFRKRAEAEVFARELARLMKLRFVNLIDGGPDEA